ncbi:MAG: MFS transporter [Bryobacterales bacterium]|nr:MFS transporter [Bryobacterales bacterium]
MSEIGEHGGDVRQETEGDAGGRAKFADGHLEKSAHSDIVDKARWGILGLLFASITINLLDRQVLSVMAPLIRDDLGLSNSEYSYIVFAFTLGLTLAQVPAGLWIDRRGPRLGLPAIMLVWSAANALHAAARTVWHFCAFRFLLGIGECGNYSAGVKVISQRFPAHERALAGGIFNSGTVIGALAAPPVLVAISKAFGWRMAFVLPSVLGLVWIVPWLVFCRERSADVGAGASAPFRPLLGLRQVWGVMLMRALAGPVVHFYWYWLPEYLRRERGFSMEMIGLLAGIPFLFAGLGNVGGGLLANSLMRRGWTADRTRKFAYVLGTGLCALSMLVPFVPGEGAAIALISVATFGLATTVANHIGLLGDLFPPRVLAGVTGLTGLAEGCTNMTLTLVTGAVVDRYSYLPVFLAAGLLPVLAAGCLFLLIRKVERAV